MWIVIGLFVVGAVLILSEFFVPGGVLGITGGLLVMASIGYSWYAVPNYAAFVTAGEFGGVVVICGVGLYLLMNTSLGDGLTLKQNLTNEEGYADHSLEQENLVGQTALVHNALRPAGSIMIGDQRIDAVSTGTYIDKGRTVRIVEVEGHRVVCELVPEVTEEPA